SLWADPTCSIRSTCRPRRVTIWTATAPEEVRTLRTNRETTPEDFHATFPSDHSRARTRTNTKLTGPHPENDQGRVRSQEWRRWPPRCWCWGWPSRAYTYGSPLSIRGFGVRALAAHP